MIKKRTLNILIVDDSKEDREAYKRILKQAEDIEFNIFEVGNGQVAYKICEEQNIGMVLLDFKLPGENGIKVLRKIKGRQVFMPVIMLTGEGSEEIAIEAVKSGAESYIAKNNINSKTLLAEIEHALDKAKLERDLFNRANYDSLTGVANRAAFDKRLRQAMARSQRAGNTFAVMFLDLNKFKEVNDTFGHVIGDLILKEAAERIENELRENDVVARFGGDEFSVLLEDIKRGDEKPCIAVADRITEAVRQPYIIEGGEAIIGVSIGIAIYSGDGEYNEDLIKYADMAMYESKKMGKPCFKFTPKKERA